MAAEYSTIGTYSEICLVPGPEQSVYHKMADSSDKVLVTDNCLAERHFDTVVIIHCGGLRMYALDNTLTMSIFPHAIGEVRYDDDAPEPIVEGHYLLHLVNIRAPGLQLKDLAARKDVVKHWAAIKPSLTVIHLGEQDIYNGSLRNGSYPDNTSVRVMLGKVFEDMYSEARQFMENDDENLDEYRRRHAFMVCPIPQASPSSVGLQESGLTPFQFEFHRRQVNFQLHEQAVYFWKKYRALYLHFNAHYTSFPENTINVIWKSVGRFMCSHPDCHYAWACNKKAHCWQDVGISIHDISHFAYKSKKATHGFYVKRGPEQAKAAIQM